MQLFYSEKYPYRASETLNNRFEEPSFHVLTWMKLHESVEANIWSNEGDHSFLGFKTAKELKEFEGWMQKYLDRFNGFHASHRYPPPVNLPPQVQTILMAYMGQSELDKLWHWVMASCKHRVWYSDRVWFFENEEDAALFRMKK